MSDLHDTIDSSSDKIPPFARRRQAERPVVEQDAVSSQHEDGTKTDAAPVFHRPNAHDGNPFVGSLFHKPNVRPAHDDATGDGVDDSKPVSTSIPHENSIVAPIAITSNPNTVSTVDDAGDDGSVSPIVSDDGINAGDDVLGGKSRLSVPGLSMSTGVGDRRSVFDFGSSDDDDDVSDYASILGDDDVDGSDDDEEIGEVTGGRGDAFVRGAKVASGRARLKKARGVDARVGRSVEVRQYERGRAVTFTEHDVRALDFLTRWSFATTRQVGRASGLSIGKERRLRQRFEGYVDLGWARCERVFVGPELWYPTAEGAKLSSHEWLGGAAFRRQNPASQSHSLGLSSLASRLLAGDVDGGRLLGLGASDYAVLLDEMKAGSAWLVSEKEFRSRWSMLRREHKGLMPAEYRHAFVDRLLAWSDEVKAGSAGLLDSPELLCGDGSFAGGDDWLWVLWGNWIWNEHVGFVNVDERVLGVDGRPVLREDLGDRFMTLDHCPDMVIARTRDGSGRPRSLAIELELTGKSIDDYARTLASYACYDGRSLFERVVWLVPNVSVARMIEAGAAKIGVGHEVFSVVPFRTLERRNSFWSGADVLPARFDKRGRVVSW